MEKGEVIYAIKNSKNEYYSEEEVTHFAEDCMKAKTFKTPEEANEFIENNITGYIFNNIYTVVSIKHNVEDNLSIIELSGYFDKNNIKRDKELLEELSDSNVDNFTKRNDLSIIIFFGEMSFNSILEIDEIIDNILKLSTLSISDTLLKIFDVYKNKGIKCLLSLSLHNKDISENEC